jgi:hypothetical protein
MAYVVVESVDSLMAFPWQMSHVELAGMDAPGEKSFQVSSCVWRVKLSGCQRHIRAVLGSFAWRLVCEKVSSSQ